MKKLLLLVVVLTALGLVIYPLYVIRPFRAQGARELQAALVVARYSRVLTLVLAMVGTVLVWQLWRGKGLLRKAGLGVAVLLLVFSAVASRINVYERMFNPVSSASFIPASEAKHEPNDMVMA